MLTIKLLGGIIKAAADGKEQIQVHHSETDNIRQLFENIAVDYPRLKKMADDRLISVSIDGNIFRDDWQKSIPRNAEICFLPRIAGG